MARRRQSRPPSHNRPVAAGWALVLAALVLGLAFLPGATGFPLALARWQRLLLGTAAPTIPAYVLVAGLILMAAGERARLSRRIVGFLMGSATALLALHAWVAGADLLGAGVEGGRTRRRCGRWRPNLGPRPGTGTERDVGGDRPAGGGEPEPADRRYACVGRGRSPRRRAWWDPPCGRVTALGSAFGCGPGAPVGGRGARFLGRDPGPPGQATPDEAS